MSGPKSNRTDIGTVGASRVDIDTTAPMLRRGFLQGLVRLPLIGGGVSLIGQPTASAEPVTPELLEAYKAWLFYERRFLSWDMAADPVFIERYIRHAAEPYDRVSLSRTIDAVSWHVGDVGRFHGGAKSTSPYTRAALVLSTVGCDWRGGFP